MQINGHLWEITYHNLGAEIMYIVHIVTHNRQNGLGSKPRWGEESFSSPHPSRPDKVPSQHPVKWVWHSSAMSLTPPHLALEVKDDWSYTSTPPLCHHGTLKRDVHFMYSNLTSHTLNDKIQWTIKFCFVQKWNTAKEKILCNTTCS